MSQVPAEFIQRRGFGFGAGRRRGGGAVGRTALSPLA